MFTPGVGSFCYKQNRCAEATVTARSFKKELVNKLKCRNQGRMWVDVPRLNLSPWKFPNDSQSLMFYSNI